MEPFLGEIKAVGFNWAPQGWALCNGQLLSIAQNTALFSLLGTTYGGNGQTTFALPNLQGRVPIHQGQSGGTSQYTIGQSGGTENVTLTINNMPAHTHTATATINASARGDQDTPAGGVPAPNSGNNIYASAADGSTKMNAGMATVTNAPAGGNQPLSVVQPYLCINFIIALQGIFPSRP